jgi:hypothetical protein
MSSRNFRNINRAFKRGHIVLIPNGQRGTSIFRRVKSYKVGGGEHTRWPKDLQLFYNDGALRKDTRSIPQKWAPL